MQRTISPPALTALRWEDQNGNLCALIKVKTIEKGNWAFDVGMLGVRKTEDQNKEHPAEIWVYVPFGATWISIQHDKLGELEHYVFPCSIDKGCTYIMKLTTGKVKILVEEQVTKQYLLFQLDPPNAILEVDDQLWSVDAEGSAMQYVDFGTYTYRVRAKDYSPEVGKVTVDDPENTKIVPVKLKSNLTEVTLIVDADAEIWVNNEKKGIRTWTGPLGSGTYKIECKQAGHETTMVSKEITAEMSGQTISLPTPTPIYGSLNVESTPNLCKLYVDGKDMGSTPKSINEILVGQHEIRLVKEGYTDYVETVTVAKGERKQVQAEMNDGNEIQFTCNVLNAQLEIDGQRVGTATGTYQLTYGSHSLKATADDYRDYSYTLNVSESGSRSHNITMQGILKDEETFTVNGVSFTMKLVEGGTFQMGAKGIAGITVGRDEKPVHSVTLSSYYMGETEVTQALWQEIMGTTVSQQRDKANTSWSLKGEGGNYAMYYVSWDECQEFVRKLNQRTGKNFRLPTEAEWEYAARGGNKSNSYKYAGSNTIGSVAWYDVNSGSKTHAVKMKSANELGLYDMSGNVQEWCQDWYGRDYYEESPSMNPQGPSSGSDRVLRGGCWNSDAKWCPVWFRSSNDPGDMYANYGFRLCLPQ